MSSKHIRIIWFWQIALMLFWVFTWGGSADHRFGDADLVRKFIYASYRLLADGFQTVWLPIYDPTLQPYTHLPTGPEYLQMVIAWLQENLFSWLDAFRFHSFMNSALSLGILGLVARTTGWIPFFLVTSTIGFVFFATHPYCVGALVGDALAFLAFSCLLKDSRQRKGFELNTYLILGASVFLAFWMGLAPLSVVFIFLTYFLVHRPFIGWRLIFYLGSVAALSLLAAMALKIYQNYSYFGSIEKVAQDASQILSQRAGFTQKYSFLIHLKKLAWRLFYLFEVLPVFLTVLVAFLKKRFKRNESYLVIFLLLAGLSWQVLMRQHSYHHLFLLRSLMIPLMMVLSLCLGKLDASEKKLWYQRAYFVIYIQLALTTLVALVANL